MQALHRKRPRSPRARALVLGSLLIAAWASGAHGAVQSDDGVEVYLPHGEVADLYRAARGARPGPSTGEDPVPLALAWPDWTDGSVSGWGSAHPWRQWTGLLRAEAFAPEDDPLRPSRRARLALLAVRQARAADAWSHLAACGPDPIVARVLPALLPGVPLEALAEDGGGLGVLEPGVRLTPSLPPARDGANPGTLEGLVGRDMRYRGLRVGETTLEMTLIVEGDGVQIDLIHHGGPPTTVNVVPPVAPGVELGLVYSNWEVAGEGQVTVEVLVEPEPKRKTVWARFRPKDERWPAPRPDELGLLDGAPSAASQAELLVVVPEARLESARLARFAEAIAELFGRGATLTTAAGAGSPKLFEPTAIHLASGEADERKLLGVLSMIEAHALAGAARR